MTTETDPQPSYAQGDTSNPLWENTLDEIFREIANRFPDREALVSCHESRRYTYRAVDETSDALASALLDLGIEPGDRVGIWSHNSAAWTLLQLATAKIGAVLVNINPAYRVSELDYALADGTRTWATR